MFFIIVSLKYLDEAPANGVDHGNSSDQIAPSSSRLKPEQSERSPGKKGVTKEVMFDIGDSRRSSNSYVPSESDLEDDEESSQQEMDLLDDTSRIPRYLINIRIQATLSKIDAFWRCIKCPRVMFT